MSNSLNRRLRGKTIKIFGPPGTGKTENLLKRVQRYLRQGYSPDEIQDLVDGDIKMVDCESLEVAKTAAEKHISSKGSIPYSSIMKYIHRDGHDVWILCRGSVVEWDNEIPLRMVGTHVDITLTVEKIKECCNG